MAASAATKQIRIYPPRVASLHARIGQSRRSWLMLIVGQALPPANVLGNRSGCSTILFQRKFDSFFFFTRDQLVSLNDPRTRVPSQNRIVVTRRTERLRCFEPMHCLA